MADARAGVDIVVAEHVAHELLYDVSLLVGATRRGDAADGAGPILLLEASEFGSGVGERLFPSHFAPGIGDLLANHGIEDAVLVVRIAPGEAALHAGMTVVRLAVFPRHHAHDLIALHLRLEGAADA